MGDATHIETALDPNRGSQMTNCNHTHRRSTTAGTALAAALIALGTAATAAADPDADPFSDLFGSANAEVPGTPGFQDALRDHALNESYPSFAPQFDAHVDAFENRSEER